MKKQNTSNSTSQKKEKRKNPFEYFKLHSTGVIVLVSAFLVLIIVNFFDVATRKTVANYTLSDYQVGQIADKTIIAEKSLPATEDDPVYVGKGEKIIRKGFPISDEGYAKLRKIAEAPTYIDFRAFANGFLYALLLALLTLFLFSDYVIDRKLELKEMIFLSVCFVLVYSMPLFLKKLSFFYSQFSIVSIIPSTICVILITILFDSKSALSFSLLITLGVFYAVNFQTVPCLYTLASSILAIRIIRKTERRIDLITSSLLIALFNVIFLFTFSVVIHGDEDFHVMYLFYVAINAVVSGVFALGLLTPLEAMLNTSSVFRLMDLSDTSNQIMKKLQINAPGTFNHSTMVAILSENACNKIGANGLLARVGAYYHDIGKIDQPEYFVENQHGQNKHDEINPRISASVIKSHVKKGVEKANQLRFPKEVIDIIESHHGNGLVSFFYNEAKQENDTMSPEDFSYPGPLPQTKEAAVVMLADTVEAACHTLKNPSVPRLEKFVHTLIMGKVESRQLDECPLRFCDLDKIEESFITVLAGYYHSRIAYPDQKDPDSEVKLNEAEKAFVKNDEKNPENQGEKIGK